MPIAYHPKSPLAAHVTLRAAPFCHLTITAAARRLRDAGGPVPRQVDDWRTHSVTLPALLAERLVDALALHLLAEHMAEEAARDGACDAHALRRRGWPAAAIAAHGAAAAALAARLMAERPGVPAPGLSTSGPSTAAA